MHIREDLLIIEVVDEENQPVPAGTPGQRVLLTNLVNHIQPLIRYEVTDTITMAECTDYRGTPFARIANVGGRSGDILSMPGRDGGRVAVHPFRLRAPFARLLDVRQFQIESDDAGLHVAVVLRGSAPADLPGRVRSALAGELAAAGAVPPPISVTPVATIEREGGQASKFKLIKCR
jgi:phenylacetate-coenzyme A ligase PaaK-like adenylate-forming protein